MMTTTTTATRKNEHALARKAAATTRLTTTRATTKAPATSPALEPHPLDAYAAATANSKNNQDEDNEDDHDHCDWMALSRMRCAATAAYAAHAAALAEEERDDVITEAARMCSRFQKMRQATARMASAIKTMAEDSDSSDQLQVDVARERCMDLQGLLRRLAESATFLSATAVPQAFVLGKELARAAQWMCDAEARAAAMASELVARDREVAALREALRIAQHTATSTSSSATKEDGILKRATSDEDADTESESDEEAHPVATEDDEGVCKSDSEGHKELIDYKDQCGVLQAQMESQGEKHKLALHAAITRLMSLQEQLAESRAMLKNANANTCACVHLIGDDSKNCGKKEVSTAVSAQDDALLHSIKTALKSTIEAKPKRSWLPAPKIKVPLSVYSRGSPTPATRTSPGTEAQAAFAEPARKSPARKTSNTTANTTKRNAKPLGVFGGSGAVTKAVTTTARARGPTRAVAPPQRAWRI